MPRRLAELTGKDWCYLVIALAALARARLVHATVPGGRIVANLERRNGAAVPVGPSRVDLARLSWAIGAVAERVPWRADCLVRVIAAEDWLRRAGSAPTFHLGVARDGSGAFKSHAWLTCEGATITGGDTSMYAPLFTPGEHGGT